MKIGFPFNEILCNKNQICNKDNAKQDDFKNYLCGDSNICLKKYLDMYICLLVWGDSICQTLVLFSA